MDFLTAAHRILESAEEPLRYEEITRRALAKGLIETSGKTPEATMGARLYSDVKKEDSRFEKVGRATFWLKDAGDDDIGRMVDSLNSETKQQLSDLLHSMSADRFETLISVLLVQIGFDEQSVQVTSFGGDKGIDVRGVLNAGDITEVNVAVQAKKWKGNIGSPIVRNVRGSLTTHEQGIIITTSDFSKGARTEANEIGKTPISLVNGEELVELMIKHNVGVTKERHTVFSIDDEWWNEISGVENAELDNSAEEPAIELVPSPSVEFPLTVISPNDPEIMAQLLNGNGQMFFNGTQYSSASAAGRAANGRISCNGWKYWKYQHPETMEWRYIDDLRIQQRPR